MKLINFITVHPDFLESYSKFGVFRSAIASKAAELQAINLREFAVDRHGSVDAYPYGGGDSMVMRPEPIRDALNTLPKGVVLHLSPKGRPWTQDDAKRFAKDDRPLHLLCSRFAGIDQRAVDLYVDEEISLGDYVVSGGELGALLLADSIVRLLPGALGNETSSQEDSFSDQLDGLLEYPIYTRPPEFEGEKVPDVLISGNHERIAEWRRQASRDITERVRPDLLKGK